ncbi:MAG: hypothetical protein C0621_10765 [Desulfuromonas sp.]|nr:MAG: hypothetical protein C0621_10765 [Desulfuromonas sp.]
MICSSLQGEFSLLSFTLQSLQKVFPPAENSLLQLRSALLAAARKELSPSLYATLFSPPLCSDPAALRRYQRGAPPFAILPDRPAKMDASQQISLTVSFWGEGIPYIGAFLQVLMAVGEGGHSPLGTFSVTGIRAVDASGGEISLELDPARLAPPLIEVNWWLSTIPSAEELRWEFLTPARLLSVGRPLFSPSLSQLFPFVLRRVSSMLYYHCGVESVDDPGEWLALAARVKNGHKRWKWQDWRQVEPQRQRVGGIVGHLTLAGGDLDAIRGLLHLGALMNLGKGAAWGCGHYRLWRPGLHSE